MGKNDLTRSLYTGVDYQTALDDLRNRLAVEFREQFNDFSVSDMAFLLLDSIAYAQDTISFYQDQRATENYLSLAQTRNGIARVARTLGYKPQAAVPASVDLSLNLNQVYAFPITIPENFTFTGEDGLIFTVAQSVTIPASSPITDVFSIPVYQGQRFTDTFASDGLPNQVVRLARTPDDQFLSEVRVVVNGSSWEEVEFLTFESTNQYEVDYYSSPPSVRFGNSVRGNIPPTGATIQVQYIVTSGQAGNLTENRITVGVNPLVVSFQNILYTVTNLESCIGGSNPETFESIRANAPKVFNTRNVAVTRSDYETLAGRFASPLFGRVAVAQALNTRGALTDVYLQTQLSDIDTEVSTTKTAINAQTTLGIASLATADTQVDTVDTLSDSIIANNDTAVGALTSARTAVRTAKDNTLEVSNDLSVINSYVSVTGTLRTLVDGIAVAGSSQLTSGDKTTILSYLDTILAQNSAATALSSSIETGLETAASQISGAISELEEVGTTAAIAGSLVESIQTAATTTISAIAAADANFDTIDTTIASALTDIDQYTDNISDHFTEVYSNDCKANLVTVPILAYNADGFYAAPSNSLVDATQTYLEGIKDVTHTVKVVSGELYLVPAVITIRLGVINTFNQSVLSATVAQLVDGILKNRKFGQSLYLSDLIEPITDVTGIGFVNVTINGYLDTDNVTVLSSKNDINGNLIAENQDIITKGTVTINTETYIPSN